MAKEGHSLSKSTFIRGQQCQKSLYLHKKRPFLRDKLSPEQLAKFRRGHDIGNLAWELFPGGITCAPAHPTQYKASIEKTRQLIEQQAEVIYEAAFSYNGVLILLDILVRTDLGWQAYEVKSSLAISDTYITDAALQYNIITGSGLELNSFSIIHLNPDYIRKGGTKISELFRIEEVTSQVKAMQSFITEQISLSKETLALKHSPAIPVGLQCYNPYPCDFIGHCWKNVGETSVFSMKGIPFEKRDSWSKYGYAEIADIPNNIISPDEKEIIDAHLNGTDLVKREALQQLSGMNENTIFVAFLVIRPAIPLFDGFKPFEPVIVGLSWLQHDGSGGTYIVPDNVNPLEEIRNHLQLLISPAENLIHAGGEKVRKALLANYLAFQEKHNFTDLSEILSKHHFYRPGIDPEAEIGKITEFLQLENPVKGRLSQIMQGVTYLENRDDKENAKADILASSLQNDVKSCKAMFEFLIKQQSI